MTSLPTIRPFVLGALWPFLPCRRSALAQDDELRDVVDQHMTWYMLFGNHRLNDHLGIHTEYQF